MKLPITQKKLLSSLMLFCWILLLISILIVAKSMDDRQKELLEVERVSLLEKGKDILTPYEVLNSKNYYQKKAVTIRAQVYNEPMVCEKSACPKDDQCCGCSLERDLLAKDFRVNVQSEGLSDSLRLKQNDGQAICKRKEKSCDYSCGDWQVGSIYDIDGVFSYTEGPQGWRRPTGIYLETINKKLLRIIGFQDKIGSYVDKLGAFFAALSSETYYILP